MIGIRVDNNAALDIGSLEGILEDRLQDQQAIYSVVAVIGSTEEGAVDDLEAILKHRSRFQKKDQSEISFLVQPLTEQAGLSFAIHVDAAWGGYFASLLSRSESRDIGTAPSVRLRLNVEKSLRCMRYADSITIDPHKSGYVTYPGFFCLGLLPFHLLDGSY